jgi:hypothetical protein
MHRDVIHMYNDVILRINVSLYEDADCKRTENIRTTKYVCRILVTIASKQHLQPRSPWQRRYWQDSPEHW